MPQPREQNRTAQRVVYLAVALLLLLAAVKFVFQDGRRLAYPMNDLTTPWVSSQAFLHGNNPYSDIQELSRIWSLTHIAQAGKCTDFACILAIHQSVYPPTTLALIAPLGLLHWRTAVYAYTLGSSALFVMALLVLAQKLSPSWKDWRKLYFVAFALAMAPLHSGIHEVNLITLVVVFLCAGVGLLSDRPYAAGIALAIAACLKPQVAIFFFAYPWLRRKWKTAFASLGTLSLISACSLIWLRVHHQQWLGSFLSQLAQFSAPGGPSGAEAPGPGKFPLLNLRVLTFQLTLSRNLSSILAWTIFALLAAVAVYLIVRRVTDENESAGVAIIAVLTLLPVYHRYYTASILLFVLYWAVEHFDASRAKAALLFLVPLLVPFAAIMERSGIARRLMDNHSALGVVWNDFLMPHVIWIELLLLLLLFVDVSVRTRRLAEQPVPAQAGRF
jgi:hypothetical protein